MNETLGNMLRRAMERKGITGVELAERIGRTASFVSELINDEKKVPPPPATLAAIERELGVSQVVMLNAWGYTVHPSGPRARLEPGREAVLNVLEEMTDEERLALADAGAILLRLRRAQNVVHPREERVLSGA